MRGHIPELDGIRGLAIGGVMALHFLTNMAALQSPLERAVSKLASYGLWGVDLFFVLSGFLITGILYDAKGGARYFRSFYMRRTLRIFPLYYGVLALTMIVIPRDFLARYAPGFLEVREIQGWLWPYLTNFYLAGEGEFSIPYVSHFWTLAIEEHFYLFWPFVVAFLSRTAAMRACVALSLIALSLRLWFSHFGPNELYVQILTPCRLDSLCAGAWFALAVRGPEGVKPLGLGAPRWLTVLASSVVFISVWHAADPRWDATLLPLRTTLLSLFFAVFILFSAWNEGPAPLKSLLRARWLVMLGKYSYGLYVYHGIVAYIMHERRTLAWLYELVGPGVLALFANALLGVLISVVISVASYEFFEVRFLHLKKWFEVAERRRGVVARALPAPTSTERDRS
jgi:peptidoglycan/LPS O-acetylase OafA/YrhL